MGTRDSNFLAKKINVNMEIYLNKGRDSGIKAYGIGTDFIIVNFKNGGFYLYTYESVGAENIERMKDLAQQGEGLNEFINVTEEVRTGYADKWEWEDEALERKIQLNFNPS